MQIIQWSIRLYSYIGLYVSVSVCIYNPQCAFCGVHTFLYTRLLLRLIEWNRPQHKLYLNIITCIGLGPFAAKSTLFVGDWEFWRYDGWSNNPANSLVLAKVLQTCKYQLDTKFKRGLTDTRYRSTCIKKLIIHLVLLLSSLTSKWIIFINPRGFSSGKNEHRLIVGY